MVASRGARLNGAQGAIRKLKRTDFDSSERPARVDLWVYRDVGFEFGLSSPNGIAGVPRAGLAT